ncbi:hypothetical protein [Paraburkholderia ribeironis]|uniref:hypothetical protein n=1 Tax=Paraburkholderia ribeironis TaxID=1247936 RepID=UPI001177787D|nr:hypothetical protein [Paraburkholderia ribeironis]
MDARLSAFTQKLDSLAFFYLLVEIGGAVNRVGMPSQSWALVRFWSLVLPGKPEGVRGGLTVPK